MNVRVKHLHQHIRVICEGASKVLEYTFVFYDQDVFLQNVQKEMNVFLHQNMFNLS